MLSLTWLFSSIKKCCFLRILLFQCRGNYQSLHLMCWCSCTFIIYFFTIQKHCRSLPSYKTLFWNMHRMKIPFPFSPLPKMLGIRKEVIEMNKEGKRCLISQVLKLNEEERKRCSFSCYSLLANQLARENTKQLFFPTLWILSNRKQNKFSHQKYLECDWCLRKEYEDVTREMGNKKRNSNVEVYKVLLFPVAWFMHEDYKKWHFVHDYL